MPYYYVYMILSKINNRYVSYVGYSTNIKKRLSLHNSSKGAKFTRGKFWKLIYSKKYQTKSLALKKEYDLKNDRKKRDDIKKKFINKL